MALADFNAYKAALVGGGEVVHVVNTSLAGTGTRPSDFWLKGAPPGVAPTSPVVPTNATAGALGQQDGGAGRLTMIGARLCANSSGAVIIADRLSHQGGLDATVTGVQSTNLPTAALSRYTDGEGVMIGLSLYTQIGTSGTTITASYTNSAGVSGRTTPAVAFGGTNYREADRMILLPLQEGDAGVLSVESVNVAGSTGTAGNFGVSLFKPLSFIAVDNTNCDVTADVVTGNFMGGLPEVVDGACLFPMAVKSSSGSGIFGIIKLGEC